MDIGRKIADLDVHNQFGVVYVHGAVGKGLGQLAAHVLAQLDAGHRKALVAALGLDLKAFGPQHVLLQIVDGQAHDGVPVLFTGSRPADLDDAEDILHRLEGGVHIRRVVLGLDIDRRLHAADAEIAEAKQAAAHIADQLLFKAAPVQSLQDDFTEF